MQALYSCYLQNCSQLIQTIEDTGTIMREVRDLEEQVRPGNGKGNGDGPGDSSLFCVESLRNYRQPTARSSAFVPVVPGT